MPIQYTSVLEEHRACRTDAAVFDVSHLGSVLVDGPQAHCAPAVGRSPTISTASSRGGRSTRTCSTSTDAHVVDDIIVWWVGDDEFLVMPNASNTARIVEALGAGRRRHRDPGDPRGAGSRRPRAARGGVSRTPPRSGATTLHAVEFDGVCGLRRRAPATRARTASSCTCPWPSRREVWRAVLGAGVTPAGLGARDTLRLESGLPLHGHELGPGITPLQAGLGWVVRWDKGDFRGRDARSRPSGARRRPSSRRAARGGSPDPACGVPGARRRRSGRRRGHERQLLAHARAGDRARVRAPRDRRRRRRRRSTSAAARLAATRSSTRPVLVALVALVAARYASTLATLTTYAVDAGRESPGSISRRQRLRTRTPKEQPLPETLRPTNRSDEATLESRRERSASPTGKVRTSSGANLSGSTTEGERTRARARAAAEPAC